MLKRNIYMGIATLIGVCLFLSASLKKGEADIEKTKPIELFEMKYDDEYKKNLEKENKHIEYISGIIQSLQPRVDSNVVKIIAKSVIRNADRFNIPEELILSIINRESSFDPMAISTADCCGLMQVNYKVHKEPLKKELKINNYYEFFYIDNNISAGCYIFSKYFKRHKNDIKKTLKNYVGGKHDTYSNDILAMYTELTVQKKIQG